MEWTDSKIIELIDLYRERPVLWDCRLPDYKNKSKRHDQLMELAAHFGIEKVEIEKKIKYLQTNLSREIKKENKGKTPGSGSAEIYTSKWFCFKALLFLHDKNTQKNTVDVVNTQYEEEDSEKTDNAPTVQQAETNNTYAVPPIANINRTKLVTSPQITLKRRKVSNKANEMSSEVLSTTKSISSKREEMDEYTLFGQLIAMKIRKLPSQQTRAIVQHKINNMLFEAEMESYSGAGTSPVSYFRDTYTSTTHLPYFSPHTQTYLTHEMSNPIPSSEYASSSRSSNSPLTVQVSPLHPYTAHSSL